MGKQGHIWAERLKVVVISERLLLQTWKRGPLESKTAGIQRPHLASTVPLYLMLNDLEIKTTCQQRPHIFGPNGGLRFQVSMYLLLMVLYYVMLYRPNWRMMPSQRCRVIGTYFEFYQQFIHQNQNSASSFLFDWTRFNFDQHITIFIINLLQGK